MKHLNMNKGLLILTLAIAGCAQTNSPSSTESASAAAADQLNKMGPPLDKVQSVSEVDAYRCGNGHKIYICHVPPGNSEARHTLCVGAPAIAAHLKHKAHDDSQLSDYVGQCASETPPPSDDGDSTGDNGDGGGDSSTGGDTSTGGDSSSGGDLNTGGDTSSGGDLGTGGDTSSGGDLGTGGDTTTGGDTSTGGDLQFPNGSDLNDPWYNAL